MTTSTDDQLTDQDRQILAFEKTWWRYAGAKETAVLERFGYTETRYYQRLAWIIDQTPGARARPDGGASVAALA